MGTPSPRMSKKISRFDENMRTIQKYSNSGKKSTVSYGTFGPKIAKLVPLLLSSSQKTLILIPNPACVKKASSSLLMVRRVTQMMNLMKSFKRLDDH